MDFKLGFGPMSHVIVEKLGKYATEKTPMMIIASRNQVDSDSGYVMTSKELSDKIKPYHNKNLMLCRDHCGPYFLDSEKSLSLNSAVEATKKTIAGDIENGFDLIHIDTSRCEDPYSVAEELFDFCLSLNNKIQFEFGTEDNVGITASLSKYEKDVAFASKFPNMKFVVAQTGSLTFEDRQTGSFHIQMVKNLVECANISKVKLKEHNADYLSSWEIGLRKNVGVHACNIAPQLGVIQTKTILDLASYYGVDSTEFCENVLSSGRWKKWTESTNNDQKVIVAGHYCFNSDSYKRLEDNISKFCDVKDIVENSIGECLNRYYTNLY